MNPESKNDVSNPEGWLRPADQATCSEILSQSGTCQFYRAEPNNRKNTANETETTSRIIEAQQPPEMTPGSQNPIDRENNRRLRAGQDLNTKPTLFQRGISKEKPNDFGKPDLPTNWGLYKGKQEEWRNDEDFTAFPTSSYSRQFKWWGKERKTDLDTRKQPPPKPNVLPVKEKTTKDWDLRGHKADSLPIACRAPEPRFPSELARDSHARPDTLRWREVNSRLARSSYEVQHPTEKWASNFYLN